MLCLSTGKESKKSILESFKEELKRSQREREDRHCVKKNEQDAYIPPSDPNLDKLDSVPIKQEKLTDSDVLKESRFGSLEAGDPQSTNLYVGKSTRSLEKLLRIDTSINFNWYMYLYIRAVSNKYSVNFATFKAI